MQDDFQNPHVLIPEAIATRMPRLFSTEEDPDPIVHLKWSTPDGSWTWFMWEYDPTDRLCFGLVDGFQRNWGIFSVAEIEKIRGPMGRRVERDLHFSPTPLSEIRHELHRER